MSFDMLVLPAHPRPTNAEAADRWDPLGEIRPIEHPAVAAFYRELTAMWPEINDAPLEQLDGLPWSGPILRGRDFVSPSCVWPWAAIVWERLIELARKHDLAVFDVGKNVLVLPDSPDEVWKREPGWNEWYLRPPPPEPVVPRRGLGRWIRRRGR